MQYTTNEKTFEDSLGTELVRGDHKVCSIQVTADVTWFSVRGGGGNQATADREQNCFLVKAWCLSDSLFFCLGLSGAVETVFCLLFVWACLVPLR